MVSCNITFILRFLFYQKKKASDNNDVYLNQSFSRMQILHVRYKFGQHVMHCKT